MRSMQLKFLLILNDLYQPFFKLGNRTAKQITNLPIFLSFFVMALSVLQISFETRNYSILQNYPKFKKISETVDVCDVALSEAEGFLSKTEGFLSKAEEARNLLKKDKQEREDLCKNYSEDEKLFIDFYEFLYTRETPLYPTTFYQILDKYLKQDVINLYKSFEQIAPMLVSEMQELEQKYDNSSLLIHLRSHLPYQNWTSENENFDIQKDRSLTNWEFDDSQIEIQDLKQTDSSDRTLSIIDEFLSQYENFLYTKNFKYEYEIHEPILKSNWFFNIINPELPKEEEPPQQEDIPVIEEEPPQQEDIPVITETLIPKKPLEVTVSETKTSLFPLKIESILEKRTRILNAKIEKKEKEARKKRLEKKKKKEEKKKKKINPLRTPVKPFLAIPRSYESLKGWKRKMYFKSKKEIPQILVEKGIKMPENLKKDKKTCQDELYQSLTENKHFAKALDYPIHKIGNQIPRKMEGVNEGEELKPCPSIFQGSDHHYQPEKVAHLFPSKEKLSHVISEVNKISIEHSKYKLWECCAAPREYLKTVIFPWNLKYPVENAEDYLLSEHSRALYQRMLVDFLALLVEHLDLRYYSRILHKLKQLQNLKYFVHFDVQWARVRGRRAKRLYFQVGDGVDPNIIYRKRLGFRLRSTEEKRLEEYVLKVAPFIRNPMSCPIYKFYNDDSIYVFTQKFPWFNFDPYAVDFETIDEEIDFETWREKKHNETFDFYSDDISPLLKFQKENPHFDELVNAEDYLLEALFEVLKRYNFDSTKITKNINISSEDDVLLSEAELREAEVREAELREAELRKAEEVLSEAEVREAELREAEVREAEEVLSEAELREAELREAEEFSIDEEFAPSITFNFLQDRKKQRDSVFKNNANLLEMKDTLNQKRKLELSILYEMVLPNFKLFENILENSDLILKKNSISKIQNYLNMIQNDLNKIPKIEIIKDYLNTIKNDLNTIKNDLNTIKNDLNTIKNDMIQNYLNMIQNDLTMIKNYMIQNDLNKIPKVEIIKNMIRSVGESIKNYIECKIRPPRPKINEGQRLVLPRIPKDVSSPVLALVPSKKPYPFEVLNIKQMTPNRLKKVQKINFLISKLNTELEDEDCEQFLTLIQNKYPNEGISSLETFLLKDFVLSELHNFQKTVQKNANLKKVFQIAQHRQMSGYRFKNCKKREYLNLKSPRVFRYQAHNIENRQFFELRENINNYSWSVLFFFSSGWIFVNIFKNVYKKYAKEIVESGIDFLQRAGILDDVKWLKEELGMSGEQAYRGIRHQGKKFKNIIGLDRKYIILQLSEMVWFLKTKNVFFKKLFKQKVTYLKPKFLLTGPPGTGKTLLVQAVAGETGVPIVTQSGGLLQNPRSRGKGAQTLHKLFLRAREIAPCIIFIDEVDGIGSRRQFLPDGEGGYDAIEFLDNHLHVPPMKKQKMKRRFEFLDDTDPYWKEPEFTQTIQSTRIPIDVLQDMQFSRSARNEQLSILTQLLIELDGLHPLDNILVIGATNRVEILDPALLRPGRFKRILKFNLPDYSARINLLKLYTQSSKIGIEDISWDYFSKRTQGLSSADIASIVFASELTAVQLAQKHTLASLERGIDLITSFPSDPVMLRLQRIFIFLDNSIGQFFAKNHFYFSKTQSAFPDVCANNLQEIGHILRNCYYNIGKIFIIFCLDIQPLASINLWERPKNFRFLFVTQQFNFEKNRFSRIEIEKRFLAFFGGKAGESLFIFSPLQKSEIFFQFDSTFLSFANSLEQSNFGIEDEIQRAQNLLQLMIEKWYFYLEKIATEQFHPILEDANLQEYSEREKEILFGQALVDEMLIDLDMRHRLSRNEQKYSYQAWWMKKVATQLNFKVFMSIGSEFDHLLWSRIYLSDPENSAQNIEWVAPDEYFHTLFRTPPFCMSWTQFLENGRFAISNLLLLQAFNTVFTTLRQFPEFLDFVADYFLRHESVRETDFKAKISQFFDHPIS